MGVVLQVVVIYLLPAVAAFFWLFWSEARTKIELPARAIAMLGLTIAIMKMGYVARFGVWAPYVWCIGIIAGAGTVIPRILDLPFSDNVGQVGSAIMTAGGGVLAVIVAFFVASSAHDYGGTPIHLSFPLRDGPYVIVQGGTGFFFTPTIQGNAQLDAIDVVKMSDLGFRSSSLWPTDTDVHYVWSDLVKAPCDGNVLASEDDHPDLPPSMADSTAPLGNFVAIGCPEATIVLAFLQKGSLKTPQNVSVHVGDTIAKVGASGLAGEPRLRIYAVRGQERTTARLIGQAEAVPMFFGDVPLVRGDRIAQ